MKILIFGRGAIGTQYAWALEQAGHTVEFYVRKGRKEQYGSQVNLELLDGRRKKKISQRWQITLCEEINPEQDYDLIFFSVNPEQVEGAVEYLAPRMGTATLLFFNNFGKDPRKAIAPIPEEQVVFGFPGAGGGFEKNTLYGILYNNVQIGIADSVPNAREAAVCNLFESAGFKVARQKDIYSWLLSHYIFNTAMETEVVKRGSFENVVSSGEALAEMIRNVREMQPYLKAKQIKPDALTTVVRILPPKMLGWLLKHTIYKPGSMSYEAIVHNHFKAGYAVEEVLADAKAMGIKLPRLQAAVDMGRRQTNK